VSESGQIDNRVRGLVFPALDRVAATESPYWEVDPSVRSFINELLGSPQLNVEVRVNPDGSMAVEGIGEVFLAVVLMLEAAVAEMQDLRDALSREESVFRLRQRLSALLGIDQEGVSF